MKELEATLHAQIKELEKECTDAEATKKLQKKLKGSEVHRTHEKAVLMAKLKNPTTDS
jgi:hypothetical protein